MSDEKQPRKSGGGGFGEAMSAIRWVAIATVFIVVALIGWKVYEVATAPVRAAQGMGKSVTDASKAIQDRTSDMINRLDVDVAAPKTFGQLSEEAFRVLNNYPINPPRNVADRVFRAANLRDSDNKVCALQMDFGNGPIPVFAAANNAEYETAKALGSKEDRIIRVHIMTGSEDIAVRSYWDAELDGWAMRWRRATFGKAISDKTAQERLIDVLAEVPVQCVVKMKTSE